MFSLDDSVEEILPDGVVRRVEIGERVLDYDERGKLVGAQYAGEIMQRIYRVRSEKISNGELFQKIY